MKRLMTMLLLLAPTALLAANAETPADTIVSADGKFAYIPDEHGVPKELFQITPKGHKRYVGRVLKPEDGKMVVNTKPNADGTYDVVERMPQFPGGTETLMKFLAANVKYPADAKTQKIQGRVIVTFVVEKDGSVKNARVVKKVYPSLDAEALRVVNAMPKWTPGMQEGKPVRVKYTVPITFKLS